MPERVFMWSILHIRHKHTGEHLKSTNLTSGAFGVNENGDIPYIFDTCFHTKMQRNYEV